MTSFRNFRQVYGHIVEAFLAGAKLVHTDTWQGVSIANKPEMATYELEDVFFQFPVGTMDLDYHRMQVGPNTPWANRHFELDRVSGEPLNPGLTWKEWPYALKADSFRDEHGQFNHSYAERMWPKLAGKSDQGELRGTYYDYNEGGNTYKASLQARGNDIRKGIRYEYGDLRDVVNLLVKNPLTRNAYLPIWFPEDTGVVHGGRTPCSIGYLFRLRDDKLSIFYDIRSCDMHRHFKDDVYLTIRLLLWMIEECRKLDPKWNSVRPGNFSMHIGSLHIFRNDWNTVTGPR